MRITCCIDCQERHVGCHGSCQKYIAEREAYIASNRAIVAERAKYAETARYVKDSRMKMLKKKNRRK